MLFSSQVDALSFAFYHTRYGLDQEGSLAQVLRVLATSSPERSRLRIHYQDDDVIVFDNRLRWAL
jgi:hypothetical protein